MCLLAAESLLTPAEPEADYHLQYSTVQAFLALDPGGENRMRVFNGITFQHQRKLWELFTAKEYSTMDRVLLLHAYVQSLSDAVKSQTSANGEVSMPDPHPPT